MMRIAIATGVVVCGIAVAGYTVNVGQRDLKVKLAEQEERLEQIAAENKALVQKIVQLKADNEEKVDVEAVVAKAVTLAVSKQFQTLMQSNIAAVVQAQLDERIGTMDDINAIFQDTVRSELTAAEEAKQEERRLAQEKRRADWERRRQEREDERLAKLQEDLGLTDGQRDEVKAVQEETRKLMRESWGKLRENGGDLGFLRNSALEIRSANDEQMREILSEEQYNTYTNQQASQFNLIDAFLNGTSRLFQPRQPQQQ